MVNMVHVLNLFFSGVFGIILYFFHLIYIVFFIIIIFFSEFSTAIIKKINQTGVIYIMNYYRYFIALSFSLILIFSNISFANAQKNNIFLNFDYEKSIGIGLPTIQKASSSVVLPSKPKQNHQQSQIIYSITILPSTLTNVIELPFEFKNGEYLISYNGPQDISSNAGRIKSKNNENIGLYFVSTEKLQDKFKYTTKIKDNSLALSIETNKLLEPVSIDIEVIFPTISTYFSKHDWIKRGKIESLSFTPTPYLLSSANYEISLIKNQDSWEKIEEVYKNDAKWSNMSGLQKQFNCHYDFAKKKSEWNLEPARKNVSYFATIRASCNPGF